MKKNHLSVAMLGALLFMGVDAIAQNLPGGVKVDGGTITTAVPFLSIAPDSRSGAMGDVGVSTSSDAAATHHNAAKLAFAEMPTSVGLSHSPWLRKIGASGVNMNYLSGYHQLNDKSTIASSFRYFSFGDISLTDNIGNHIQQYKPNEFAFDAAYIRKMSENFSMSMAARFIHSDLGEGTINGPGMTASSTVGLDVMTYYQTDKTILNTPTKLSFGGGLTNIGPKMSYGAGKSFLPTMMKAGGTAGFTFNSEHALNWSLEFNKLLVPSEADNEASVASNLFDSFGQSQLAIGTGAEYWYRSMFAIRSGFFSDQAKNSQKQYFTAGAGIKYNKVGFDFSYLMATKANNPLANTLRFSLSFDIEAGKRMTSKEDKEPRADTL